MRPPSFTNKMQGNLSPTIEERLEVGANVSRGVLLNEQSGRGVPAK
jgi:hypothetical protein